MQKYRETILYSVIAILLIVFAFTKFQPAAVKLFGIEKDLSAKTAESSDLDRKLETLKADEAGKDMQLAGQLKKIYKPEFSGMDAESSFTVVFDDIIDMAKYNGVKIYSIEYVYNPPSDEVVIGASDKYNVCQLNMQVIADYSDFESFFRELYKYPYLVNIDKIEMVPYQKNKAIILGTVQLKLYAAK